MNDQTTPAGSKVDTNAPLGASLLIVHAEVRYWEDATVNGVEDSDGTRIPHKCGDVWAPVIELASGTIRDWPSGTTADIHYKVCDAGHYWLADAAGSKLWKWRDDYVPDRLLCIGERGYGDYIIMQIGADGRIVDFVPPTICEQEWIALPNNGDSWVLGLKKQPKLEGVSESL